MAQCPRMGLQFKIGAQWWPVGKRSCRDVVRWGMVILSALANGVLVYSRSIGRNNDLAPMIGKEVLGWLVTWPVQDGHLMSGRFWAREDLRFELWKTKYTTTTTSMERLINCGNGASWPLLLIESYQSKEAIHWAAALHFKYNIDEFSWN